MEPTTLTTPLLPVVIVGKDRTRMTCAVIDHLKEHIKNAKPYFICVSDRSRAGHDIIVENHLKEIGETDFRVLHTTSLKGSRGLGAAMNIGLKAAYNCVSTDSVLVVENDWLLVKDIDIPTYIELMQNTCVAMVDFKWTQTAGEEFEHAGRKYLVRRGAGLGECTYNVEFGCFMMSRRLYDVVGGFCEDERSTNISEMEFVRAYDALPEDTRRAHYLVVHDKEFSHPHLNAEGCTFLHVGIRSQHENQPDWGCPQEFRHLSDESQDAALCRENYRSRVALVAIARDEDDYIDEWLQYHLKMGFDEIFVYQNEWRCKKPIQDVHVHWIEKDGTAVQMAAYQEWIEEYGTQFDFAAFLDIDEFLVMRDGLSMHKFLTRFIDEPAVYIPWRVFGDNGLSGKGEPGVSGLSVLKRFTRCALDFHYLGKMFVNLNECPTGQNLDTPHGMARNGVRCPVICADGRSQSLGFWNVPKSAHVPCEIFHFRNKTMEERKLRDANPRVFDGLSQDMDFDKYNRNEMTDTAARDFLYGSIGEPVCWQRYFDRVYCLHFLPQENKIARLKSELSRVGLWGNPIFEMRYTSPTQYDSMIWDREKDRARDPQVCFVNICLEVRRILAEAKSAGYQRILLMENDVAFLRDTAELCRILEQTPNDCDVVQYDKFVNDGEAKFLYEQRLTEARINDCFIESTGLLLTSAACFALSARGINEMLRLLDEHIYATDLVFIYMRCRRAVAIKNLAIQVFSPGAYSIDHDGIEYMHKVYANGGVDYSEYSLPEGYGYGCLYEPTAVLPQRSQKGRKFVSVYAIARNEASFAERWYECAKEADEVCVLVNNSTDDTADILRRLGAKVTVKDYDDWSFAVARNEAMSLVSPESEILFTFDLDETIAPGWRKTLEEAWIAEEAKGNRPVACVYKYIWSFLPNGQEAQSFSISKIHANGIGRWKYRCHELLTELNGYRFFLKQFVVEHHQNTGTNRSRYLGLLKKDAADLPQDDRVAFYYARELMYEENWSKSIEEHKRHLSLRSATWKAERAASMRNIATCYEHLKSSAKQELWLWKAAAEDPNHREAYFRLGQMFLASKDYKSALDTLAKCIAIKEPSLEYISPPIVWSGYPHFLYSQALWWNNDWDGAVREVEKAVSLEPNNKEFIEQMHGMKATKAKFNR